MKKTLFIVALLFVLVFTFNREAFSWGASGGDGSNYGALQETAVFFNNSGAAVTAGDVVVIDRVGTGVTQASTLGAWITVSGTADTREVMGIVKSVSAADQTPVVVITKGPAQAKGLDATEGMTTGLPVGMASTAGYIGAGTHAGFALEAGSGRDGDKIWIWVDPDAGSY